MIKCALAPSIIIPSPFKIEIANLYHQNIIVTNKSKTSAKEKPIATDILILRPIN